MSLLNSSYSIDLKVKDIFDIQIYGSWKKHSEEGLLERDINIIRDKEKLESWLSDDFEQKVEINVSYKRNDVSSWLDIALTRRLQSGALQYICSGFIIIPKKNNCNEGLENCTIEELYKLLKRKDYEGIL